MKNIFHGAAVKHEGEIVELSWLSSEAAQIYAFMAYFSHKTFFLYRKISFETVLIRQSVFTKKVRDVEITTKETSKYIALAWDSPQIKVTQKTVEKRGEKSISHSQLPKETKFGAPAEIFPTLLL